MAEPTPAPGGTSNSSTSSFSQRRPAWRGAPPPKAIMVKAATSFPFSTAWTRAALAMFSSTTSATPTAADPASRPSAVPTEACSAVRAAPSSRSMPGAPNVSADRRPRTRLASVTVGSVPPRPYEAGPGSDPALSGPTRIWPRPSTAPIEPPPAPISIISMTGMEMGMPEPLVNRWVRATSKVLAVRGVWSSIRQILAVVPPMSYETTRSRPCRAAMSAAKMAPPAGPDSMSRTGYRAAASTTMRPPPEWMRYTGQEAPAACSCSSRRRR